MLKKAENKYGTGVKYTQPTEKTYTYFGLGALPVDWALGRDIRNILTYRDMVSKAKFEETRVNTDTGYRKALDEIRKAGRAIYEPPTHDQDGSSSCVPQAGCWYQAAKNFLETGIWEALSVKDVYPYIRLAFGGSHIELFFDHKNNQGITLEKYLSSYENGQPPSEDYMKKKVKLGRLAEIERFKSKGSQYRQIVQSRSIDKVAEAIRDYFLILSGVKGTNNGTWYSEFPQPPAAREFYWQHGLVFGGYGLTPDGKKYILIKNSWGKSVGVNGWQKLTEEYFLTGNVFNIHFDDDEENISELARPFELANAWLKENFKKVQDKYPDVYIGSVVHDLVWKEMQIALELEDYTRRDWYDYGQFLLANK